MVVMDVQFSIILIKIQMYYNIMVPLPPATQLHSTQNIILLKIFRIGSNTHVVYFDIACQQY